MGTATLVLNETNLAPTAEMRHITRQVKLRNIMQISERSEERLFDMIGAAFDFRTCYDYYFHSLILFILETMLEE
jgi:hypothetical protein